MEALRRIGETGASGLDVVAGGVGEALVDTAAGIMVAIAMVLLHQFLKSQLGQAVLEVQLLIEDAADSLSRLPVDSLRAQAGPAANSASSPAAESAAPRGGE